MKKGRISKEEESIIEQSIGTMSYEEIAQKLDRDPESVQNFIKRKFKVGATNEEQAAFELDERPYWVEIKNQFTDDELKLFRYHWARIISQFRDDVIPTEELQVVDLIKMEILMNRALKSNKENIEQIRLIDQ